MSISSVSKIVAGAFCLTILTNCSVIGQLGGTGDERVDYKKSSTIPTLELPPNVTLTTSDQFVIPDTAAPTAESATFSGYTQQKRATQGNQTVAATEAVLPKAKNIEIKRNGTARWLEIKNTSATATWTKLRQFWAEEGFKLTTEDQKVGIMETEWKENRADIPQDALRRLLGGVADSLYSASTRDRYRTRLERLTDSTLEVYISHRGAEEVTKGDHFAWQPRPVNPELEAEILTRLMVFLGVEKTQAKTVVAATQKPATRPARAELRIVADKAPSLQVRQALDKTWQLVGLALDRVGFVVEDRDVSKGVYFVRYIDPEREGRKSGNFFTRLFSGSEDENSEGEFLIQLRPVQKETQVIVLNKRGAVESSRTAEKILTLLYEQLK